MDFAAEEMRKHGWKRGIGLGKKEDGIVDPIRASLKRDRRGIGSSLASELTNDWWTDAFNSSAKQIALHTDTDGEVCVKFDGVKNKVAPKADSSVKKKIFVKAGDDHEEDEEKSAPTAKDVLGLCGGRTGHRAARHGIRLAGKLQRLKKQEEHLEKHATT
ncbi:G patch domain-containing protein 4-like isoform X2 [Oscarella lobularis]|uniref:G patch domain-containing protein 4-like isoform X2 n=1 Tax=Oscarella lobularis TaxID=121494 RepID=UPI003313D6B5